MPNDASNRHTTQQARAHGQPQQHVVETLEERQKRHQIQKEKRIQAEKMIKEKVRGGKRRREEEVEEEEMENDDPSVEAQIPQSSPHQNKRKKKKRKSSHTPAAASSFAMGQAQGGGRLAAAKKKTLRAKPNRGPSTTTSQSAFRPSVPDRQQQRSVPKPPASLRPGTTTMRSNPQPTQQQQSQPPPSLSATAGPSTNTNQKAENKFKEGQQVYYKSEGKAEIVKVHYDDELEPFYTIKLLPSGKEKQTTDSHLHTENPIPNSRMMYRTPPRQMNSPPRHQEQQRSTNEVPRFRRQDAESRQERQQQTQEGDPLLRQPEVSRGNKEYHNGDSESEASIHSNHGDIDDEDYASADEGFVVEEWNDHHTSQSFYSRVGMKVAYLLVFSVVLWFAVSAVSTTSRVELTAWFPNTHTKETPTSLHTCFMDSSLVSPGANDAAQRVMADPLCAVFNASDPLVKWRQCPLEAVCFQGAVVACSSGLYELEDQQWCRPTDKTNNTLEAIKLLLLEWSSTSCPLDSKDMRNFRPSFWFAEMQHALGASAVGKENQEQLLELGVSQKIFLWDRDDQSGDPTIRLHPSEPIHFSAECHMKRYLRIVWEWACTNPLKMLGGLLLGYCLCRMAYAWWKRRQHRCNLKIHVERALGLVYDLLQRRGSVTEPAAFRHVMFELELRHCRGYFAKAVWPRVVKTIEADGAVLVSVFVENQQRKHQWEWNHNAE